MDMESRISYNFGMAKPEGYRKSQKNYETCGKNFNYH